MEGTLLPQILHPQVPWIWALDKIETLSLSIISIS